MERCELDAVSVDLAQVEIVAHGCDVLLGNVVGGAPDAFVGARVVVVGQGRPMLPRYEGCDAAWSSGCAAVVLAIYRAVGERQAQQTGSQSLELETYLACIHILAKCILSSGAVRCCYLPESAHVSLYIAWDSLVCQPCYYALLSSHLVPVTSNSLSSRRYDGMGSSSVRTIVWRRLPNQTPTRHSLLATALHKSAALHWVPRNE